jgi:hypothetical protein
MGEMEGSRTLVLEQLALLGGDGGREEMEEEKRFAVGA